MPSTQRLVVVSNRLPVTLKRAGDTWHTERSTGGLATAMNPILQQTGGIWIGWPGESGADDDQRRRLAEPEFGEWLANELAAMLEGMLADTELRVQRGRRNVEVKPAWANKGEVVELVLRSCADPDFRLAIGDDITDEDMFERLGRRPGPCG